MPTVYYIVPFALENDMRIALMVEYDGGQYHGWQAQTGLCTIQQRVEDALSRVASHPVEVIAAGRTDTGVHATGQIIHFDSDKERTIRAWIHGANTYLPKDICIRLGAEVPQTFHARYSALSRGYRYLIFNSPIRPSLFRGNATWQYRQLDHRLMQKGAESLLGEQDFTSFRSMECQSKTPMRNIQSCQIIRKGDWIVIEIYANAFLHHMVRNIAGVLMAVGSGRKPTSWVDEVLAAKDRKMGAETAPPYGLYLSEVVYPPEFGIMKPQSGPFFFLNATATQTTD